MSHSTILRFEYADERRARVVERSVAVEVGEIADDRSRATVGRNGSAVEVRVEASDLVALRAGVNSWIRMIDVAERVSA
jgi:KEOPS complex subunit Pcc1